MGIFHVLDVMRGGAYKNKNAWSPYGLKIAPVIIISIQQC